MLNAASVKLHAELLARHSGELVHAQGRIPRRCVAQEGDNFGGEFVRPARPRPVGKQTREAILVERPDRLVAGGTREPEADRAMRNRQLLGAHGAHHLVLDLQHVPRIEERFLDEAPVVGGRQGGFACFTGHGKAPMIRFGG